MSSSNPLNLPTKTYTELIVSNQPATPGEHVVFLYGALMHPMITRQTIARDTPNLEVAPAALDNHTRLHVANEEYPALLPSEAARKILREGRLREEDTTVRGVLVKGLTQHDVEQLDEAQGSKYSRKTVQCTPLSTFMPLSSVHSRQVLGDLTSPFDSSTTTTAYAYVWNGPIDQLTPQVWTFDGFLEENVYSWFRRIPPETHEQSCDFRDYHLVLGPVGGEGMILPVMLRGEAVPEVK